MSKVATVEKVENGYVVTRVAPKAMFVAKDPLELAAVFDELWPEVEDEPWDIESPEARVPRPEEIPGVTRGVSVVVAHAPVEWPSEPTAPAGDDVQRLPVADDGFEYPPVRQEAPNHFVISCPNHGEQRMERAGSNWVCSGKTDKQACGIAVPRSAMSRAIRAA